MRERRKSSVREGSRKGETGRQACLGIHALSTLKKKEVKSHGWLGGRRGCQAQKKKTEEKMGESLCWGGGRKWKDQNKKKKKKKSVGREGGGQKIEQPGSSLESRVFDCRGGAFQS